MENIVNKLNYLVFAVLILTVSIFSGCTLVETNQYKYMTQTVAQAERSGYKVTVTMEEFLTYYSNYAGSYMQNGMSKKETTEQIVNMIINRKLFVDYLKDYKVENNNVYTLSNADINDCWSSVYDYVYEKLDSYKSEIYTDWGLEIEEEETSDKEEGNEFSARTPYEHEYTIVNGKLVKVEKEDETDENVAINPNPFNQYFWQESEKDVSGYTTTGAVKTKLTEFSDGIREEEMKRFVKDLKSAESYKKEKDNSSFAIFNRELERVYKIQEDNKYIEKYQEIFEDNYVLKGEDVVDLFSKTLKSQIEKYSSISAYNDAMKSSNADVYYHPTQGWFYVSHLLIGYDDAQKAKISTWKSQVEKGIITQAECDANIDALKLELKATARDSEGNETTTVKSAQGVLDEVNSALSVYGNDSQARINAFTDLIYKYTSESSFLTRDFDYAIPFNEEYDSMVEEFATASREVQTQGVSSISGLVYTEYGAHIIMYTGLPTNVSLTAENVTLQDLWNVQLKSSSSKNMLDLFAGKVTKNSYSDAQNSIIDQLRDGMDISYSKTKLKKFL